jgi:3-deoxy-D-manno-octulosonic acid (KDO) 8-phosphate synthase
MRNRPAADRGAAMKQAAGAETADMDYLDIPAFLRRQAD